MSEENENVEAEETSTLAAEFDAKAFNDADIEPKAEESVEAEIEAEETASDNVEETNEIAEEENEESDWNEVPNSEDKEELTTAETEETVEAEGNEETTVNGWQTVAEELGVDAENYEAFIDTLKGQKELAAKGATNDKIVGLNNLVSLDDEKLMREELNARGFNKEEVEDEIDIMIENNTIRSEARRVRKDLEGIIESEKNAVTNSVSEVDATQQQEIEEAAEELKHYMSTTNEMFGGRINKTQREQHSNYIASGEFFDEISQDAQSMAQAAWLWKYKDQILNGRKSAGVEKGKASILNKMTNPEPTRRTTIPDPDTGEFNPSRFNDSETM
jgi:hypothetical protein